MIKAQKSGAGHKMSKVCRRVLTGPIVKKDTYCLEVVGKELRGKGEVNAQGEREGRGTMVEASGNLYEGQWRAGTRHGRGKYSSATGDVYEGEYVEGKRHGQGKYSYADGDVYEGEYVEGKQHGQGKYSFANGNVYEFEYAEGKRHGKGTVTYASGEVEVGCYEAGADVGQGVKWSADRATAWEVQAGKRGRTIPLDEAATIAKRIGLPPP